jgi:hypothetical protein
MFDLEARLSRALDRFGGFTQISTDYWVELETCQICLDVHTPRSVRLVDPNSITTAEIYQSGPVRLSDGTNEVWISFGSSCMLQPFKNLTKLLAKELGLKPITDYQVFDSLDHLYSSLRFSLPGYFYEWDGPELSAREQWAIETGHLLKVHYQRSWDSPVIDLGVDFHESVRFETEQFGLNLYHHGLLFTLSGAEISELDRVCNWLRETLHDYTKLLTETMPYIKTAKENPST